MTSGPAGKALPAAAPTAAPAAAAVATTSSGAPFGLRTRLVHIQGTSPKLGAIQRCNCLISFFGVRHFHETESPRTTGIPVGHDTHAIHLTVSLEQAAQFLFTGIEIQVTHKNVLHTDAPQLSYLSVG
jgi:hypothetical protein